MASKEIHYPSSSVSPSSNSTSPTPESFMLETKFIVLNFMSKNPHERHPGCVYSSTVSSTCSDSAPFKFKDKKTHNSFPTSPRKSVKPHKLGQLNQSFNTSEDNVSYRYQKEHKKLLSPESSNDSFLENSRHLKPLRTSSSNEIHKKRNFKARSLDHGLSHGRYFVESDSSPITGLVDDHSVSVSTPFENYRQKRIHSELSSDEGNQSYISDADDEYESTTSSLFSSLTDCGGQGIKQGNQSIQSLSTLMSESEMETDVSTLTGDFSSDGNYGVCHTPDTVLQRNTYSQDETRELLEENNSIDNGDSSHVEKKTDGPKHLETKDENLHLTSQMFIPESLPGLYNTGSMAINDNSSSNNTSSLADRSKLRLIIRDQYEWEEERRISQVLATVEDEVNSEMVSLESEVEEAIKRNVMEQAESPFSTPLSPHSEAAFTLARIGDEIKDYYGERLNIAVSGLCAEEQRNISYENFRCVACSVIDHVMPGWRQVALLLVYGQSVAWRVAEFGYREFGELVNNTVRLISELSLDFITSQGGWGAVMNYDSSSSSSLSPRLSWPENSSPQHAPDHLVTSYTHLSSTESSKNNIIPVQDNSSNDHATLVPLPEESTVDLMTKSVPSRITVQSDVECRPISLSDIHMNFSSSDESADNHVTFLPTKWSPSNQTTFNHPSDEFAMLRNRNNLRSDNWSQNCIEQCHNLFSSPVKNNAHHEQNNTNQTEKNYSQNNPFGQKSLKNSELLSQNNSASLTEDDSLNSNTDSLECKIPESEIKHFSDSEHFVSSASWNNNTRLPDSVIVSDIPSHEESDNSDDGITVVYTQSPDNDDIDVGSDIFSRLVNIGTFVSLSICAIGIIVSIATNRK